IDLHQAMLHQAYDAFYSGDLVRYRSLVEEMQFKLTEAERLKKPAAKHAVAPTVESESNDTPLLSVSWKMFTTEKGKDWVAAVANENQRFYN
ncbi:recombinase XerC, partial [Klebsiella pneumoniae]|nr:recombinase XerC [Klebsiella pneumoniae]